MSPKQREFAGHGRRTAVLMLPVAGSATAKESDQIAVADAIVLEFRAASNGFLLS